MEQFILLFVLFICRHPLNEIYPLVQDVSTAESASIGVAVLQEIWTGLIILGLTRTLDYIELAELSSHKGAKNNWS